MIFKVVSYGAGAYLNKVFNALAALLNANSGDLFNPLVKFVAGFAVLWSVINVAYGDRTGYIKNWFVPFYAILSLFFIPTCSVVIDDQVTHYKTKVDNVPWGFGIIAGTLSQIGHKMTVHAEKVFHLPDDLQYHKTGAGIASNTIANLRRVQISDTNLKESMQSFVNQCVVYDAMLGRKYTFDDLKKSKDIWGLISSHASPARAFVYTDKAGTASQIITCAEGVKRLGPRLKNETNRVLGKFGQQLFGGIQKNPDGGSNREASDLVKKFLPGSLNYMTGMAKSANDHIMQQMMIASVVEGIDNKSSELGNARNFAVRRAYLQQRNNKEVVGGLSAKILLSVKNVMEILIYAGFILIFPLALMPRGWKFLGVWVGLVMWIQSWPVLYAVLNFIQTYAAKQISLGQARGGMTIENSVGMIDLHSDMAAQAGMLSMAVGSIAYALVKGGAHAFTLLAGQITGAATSSATAAAEGMTSGNYSFGNVTSGTVAANNHTFGQFNESPSYSSGGFTQNDGTISRTTGADGTQIVSVANSNLRDAINIAHAEESSLTEQSSKHANMAETQSIQAAQAESDMYKHTADLAYHRAHNTSGGTGSVYSENASENTSLSNLNNLTEKFAEDHHINASQAGEWLARASVSASGGFKVFGTGANVAVEGAASVKIADEDRETWSAAQDYVKQYNMQDTFSQASQAVRDMKYNEMSDKGQRYAQGVHSSYDTSNQYREEAGKNLQLSEGYSKLAADVRRDSVAINSNANQEYVNWLQQQSLPNSKGPMGLKEAETLLAARPEMNTPYLNRFVDMKVGQMTSHLQTGEGPKNRDDVHSSYANTNVDNKVSKKPMDVVAHNASKEGLGDGFNIAPVLANKVNEKFNHIENQIEEQKELIDQQGQERKLVSHRKLGIK